MIRVTSYLAATAAIALVMAPQLAAAKSGASEEGFRGIFTFGSWSSWITQSGNGQESKLRVAPALGTELQIGAKLARYFFVEYSPVYLWVQKFPTIDDKSGDASYLALLAFDAGIELPVLPIEVYAGGERGSLSFTTGTGASFAGLAGKLGASVRIASHLAVRGEYRRNWFTTDQNGSIPSAIGMSAYSFFVGVSIGEL